jgi:hypothetical protein
MAITVEGCSGNKYSFEGPYSGTDSLSDNSGVYLIVCKNGSEYDPIDVGESATIKTRVENHDRAECWKRNCKTTLMVAVYYTPNKQQAGRMEIEQDIRCKYNFPCGTK